MTQNLHDSIRAIQWRGEQLSLLDQRLLPHQETWIDLHDAQSTADAIRDMVVRGAPAIGITAAYGVVLAARNRYAQSPDTWRQHIEADLQVLAASRPTAVNLFWALDRMRARIQTITGDPGPALLAEAQAIHEEDLVANRRMGELGAAFIDEGSGVLTHCNTGSLATGGYGTALGVIRRAWQEGRLNRVFADETRPWLQGARLTAWELLQDSIPVSLVAEGAAAQLMQSGEVQWFIVGADRVAANGDTANKIGTCTAAIVARHFGVRVMVVAPTSTIDPATPNGGTIPIETRAGEELLECGGQRIAAAGAGAWNPVFDVTPASLIDVLVTEKGAIEHPDTRMIASLLSD
ncbi:MAG: S-methyl-5-thioribose-1-phosphate isomerase [Granulosicoccaceae bacterium]|jgi:methylthioribose-1-phosphate isomerase